jgi:hypothetical protein
MTERKPRALPPFVAEGDNYKMPGGTPRLGQEYALPDSPTPESQPDYEQLPPHSNPDPKLFNKPFNANPSKKEQAETARKLRELYKAYKEEGPAIHHGEVDPWTDPAWVAQSQRRPDTIPGGRPVGREFTPAYPELGPVVPESQKLYERPNPEDELHNISGDMADYPHSESLTDPKQPPKQLARMALLRRRRIAGQLPYSGRPGNPFFYHGAIAHPDYIIPDQESADSGVNSPYLGAPDPRALREFTPAYPDPGFERHSLPQANPNPPSVHFDRPLLQPIAAPDLHIHTRAHVI